MAKVKKGLDPKDVVDALLDAYPHGHEEFLPLLMDLAKLHSDKNHDYAVGGHPLGNFNRVASVLSQYPDLDLSDPIVVMLVYALKHLDSVLWGLAKGVVHRGEGLDERLMDIATYALIAVCALREDVGDAS